MDSRKIIYTLIIIIIFIFTFSIVSINKETKENVITTSSNATLSNKK